MINGLIDWFELQAGLIWSTTAHVLADRLYLLQDIGFSLP